MKIKKLFLLGTALWFSSGSYCHIEASSSWQQAENIVDLVAYIGGTSTVINVVINSVKKYCSKGVCDRLYSACACGAAGVNLMVLLGYHAFYCCGAGVIGATIGAFYDGCECCATYGLSSLISSATGVNTTSSIGPINMPNATPHT